MDDTRFDEAFDHCLAGHAVPSDAAPLAAFVGEVRTVGLLPGRPNRQLAQLFADGLLAPPALAGPRTAAPLPRASSRHEGRRTLRATLAAAVARVTPTRVVAQAAAGLGIVLAGATAAGAAGILPAPVQGQVSALFEAVTPSERPSAGGLTTTEQAPETRGGAAVDTADRSRQAESSGTPATAGIGDTVSERAQQHRVDGQDVSREARGARPTDVPGVVGHARPDGEPSSTSADPAPAERNPPAAPPAGAALPGSSADAAPGAR